MAFNKYALLRYRIIDRTIKNKYRPFPTIDDLIIACEEALFGSSTGNEISKSTIEKDLRAMRDDAELGYFAPIKYSKVEKGYLYEDPNYSINDIPLNDDDVEAIKFAAQTLNQFKDNQIFKQFQFAIDKIVDRLNISPELQDNSITDYVQFDTVETAKGSEFLSDLLMAIKETKKIKLAYKSFSKSVASESDVHPYLLKEYKHRWYLIGFNEQKNKVLTYGLDRIQSVKVGDKKYQINQSFNPDLFFKYSFGISQIDDQPTEILLQFNSLQGEYVISQPLHSSQKVIEKTSDHVLISLQLTISFELIEQLLSYGANVKVLAPEKLIKQMKELINKSLQQYN